MRGTTGFLSGRSGDLPHTVGKILDEGRLRAFTHCPQFFHYGGSYEPDETRQLVRIAYEYVASYMIRNEQLDPTMAFSRGAIRAVKQMGLDTKYSEGKTQELIRLIILWLDGLFRLFRPNNYMLVSGPQVWRVKISQTSIDLKLSAIYRLRQVRQDSRFQVVCFTPYNDGPGLVHDPVALLQMYTIGQFVRNNYARRGKKAVIHQVGCDSKGQFRYHGQLKRASQVRMQRVEQLVQMIEAGHDHPTLPCHHPCVYEKECLG